MLKTLVEFAGDRLWPYWSSIIEAIAENSYSEVWFTGDGQTGKTTAAIFGALWDLYQLKNSEKITAGLLFVFNNALVKRVFDDMVQEFLGDVSGWLKTKLVRKVEDVPENCCGAILSEPDLHCYPDDWMLIRNECSKRINDSVGNDGRIWFDAGDSTLDKTPILKFLLREAKKDNKRTVINTRKIKEN